MSAWLDPHILVILRADLTQLESGAHFTVEFVLLLGHLDMLLVGRLNGGGKIRIDIAPVGKQVES